MWIFTNMCTKLGEDPNLGLKTPWIFPEVRTRRIRFHSAGYSGLIANNIYFRTIILSLLVISFDKWESKVDFQESLRKTNYLLESFTLFTGKMDRITACIPRDKHVNRLSRELLSESRRLRNSVIVLDFPYFPRIPY